MILGGTGSVFSPIYFGEYSTGKRIADSFVKRLMLHDCEKTDVYSRNTLNNKNRRVNKKIDELNAIAENQNDPQDKNKIVIKKKRKIESATKVEDLHKRIVDEADECRKQNPDYILFKEFKACFSNEDVNNLAAMIGDYLKDKEYYATYAKTLLEPQKNKFARIFSKIILNYVAENLKLFSNSRTYKKWINIPYVEIRLDQSLTQESLNNLLDTELINRESKLKKIGICLNNESQDYTSASDIPLSVLKSKS